MYAHIQKIGKPNNIKVLGGSKPKESQNLLILYNTLLSVLLYCFNVKTNVNSIGHLRCYQWRGWSWSRSYDMYLHMQSPLRLLVLLVPRTLQGVLDTNACYKYDCEVWQLFFQEHKLTDHYTGIIVWQWRVTTHDQHTRNFLIKMTVCDHGECI